MQFAVWFSKILIVQFTASRLSLDAVSLELCVAVEIIATYFQNLGIYLLRVLVFMSSLKHFTKRVQSLRVVLRRHAVHPPLLTQHDGNAAA